MDMGLPENSVPPYPLVIPHDPHYMTIILEVYPVCIREFIIHRTSNRNQQWLRLDTKLYTLVQQL